MKNKEMKFSVLIVVIQIFLLVNTLTAHSYTINQLDSHVNNAIENSNDILNLFSDLSNFLIGFFTIKQIGTVSAQDSNFNCCVTTNDGAICQDIIPGLDSSLPQSCSDALPSRCSESVVCETGTCVFGEGVSCSANSPKQACETNLGVWNSQEITSINECSKGACVLGTEIQLTTARQCELFSASAGLETDFRIGLTEFDFPQILGNLQTGACTLGQGNCRFTTIGECDSMSGNFHKDLLCSNENLATNCTMTSETICVGDKVHFVDSCGNAGNVYDSNKLNDQNYWNTASDAECSLNLDDPNSVKGCGNCNLFLSSRCGDASLGEVSYGDYSCKSLKCIDHKGNVRINGEKWCEYDSYIGDGKDVVGSEHWLASCNFGEIEKNVCGNARGQVCAENTINEEGQSFTIASCVINEAIRCLDYNSGGGDCNENAQCQTTNVNVDEGFQYSLCTPKYPRGLDLDGPQDSNQRLCSLADNTCKVIYEKQLFGGWKCIKNCNCEKKVFSEQLNNLCISLGDCGSYINYVGEGTDNIEVDGAPTTNWNEYVEYANPVDGQFVDLNEQRSFAEAIGANVNPEFIPVEADQLIAGIGSSGIGLTMLMMNRGLPKFKNILDLFYVSKTAASGSGLTAGLQPFAAGIIGGIIGSLAAGYLAKSLGIQGTAATVMTMAGGVAGAAVGSALASKGGLSSLGFSNFGFNMVGAFWVAIVVIAIIIISGWGKIKIVEVKFTCMPWQAPTGGSNCEKCNEDPSKPCTKYRCDSLGQACTLLNGNTDNPVCQSLQRESTPPQISPGTIQTEGHEFQNQQSKKVNIRKNNGECIQEFNPVLFTLTTDEYSQCKWDFERTGSYESMKNYHGEGTQYSLEHTYVVGGLSLSLLEANNITGDLIEGFTGDINIYIKCKDYFGNFNLNDYAVNFCVNSGEDVTPPLQSLTATSPANNAILKHGISKTNFTMWTNEPAECKYDLTAEKSFNEMTNSFACKTGLIERESQGWPCTTELTDLENENTFYIKCKDQPWLEENERNINTEDFVYNLFLTENEISIDSISVINDGHETLLNQDTFEEIRGGGTLFPIVLNVETSGGSHNGEALCSYQWGNEFIPFFNSNSNVHEQELNLVDGSYEIPIKCIDPSGNEVTQDAKFILDVDGQAPRVVRTYYQSGNLNLITNEQAKCYSSFDSLKQCNFNIEDAEDMETGFKTSHSTDWVSGKTYYIKCEDVWDNRNPGCAVKITTS